MTLSSVARVGGHVCFIQYSQVKLLDGIAACHRADEFGAEKAREPNLAAAAFNLLFTVETDHLRMCESRRSCLRAIFHTWSAAAITAKQIIKRDSKVPSFFGRKLAT